MRPRPDPGSSETRASRWESPLLLASAGTLAIHVILAVAGDAIVVTHPYHPPTPPPHIELVDIEPAVVKPPPPPVPPPKPEPEPEPEPAKAPLPPPTEPRRTAPVRHVRATPAPAPTETPPPNAPPPDPSGGGPVVALPDIAPSATGVAVATGPRTTGHIGRGGSGTGTGAGTGSGSGSAPPPVSIATIKKRAMPHGDYGYFDARKDYPAEARKLGIEGKIRVRILVDEHGKVRSVALLNRLGHGLDELALQRARRIEFDPALDTDDRPVSSVVIWTFTMTLPR